MIIGLEAFRQARAKEKRDAILTAALTVFRRDGYARAAMEEIAGLAEVSTATLYRYLPSKAALFEAVAASGLETLEAALPEPGAPPLEHLSALATAYAELLASPDARALMRMLAAETGAGGDLAERFYASVKLRLSDVFAGAVLSAAEAGLIRPVESPSHVAGQLQGMIEHGTLMRGLILGDEIDTGLPPADIAAEALKTWLARWRA